MELTLLKLSYQKLRLVFEKKYFRVDDALHQTMSMIHTDKYFCKQTKLTVNHPFHLHRDSILYLFTRKHVFSS